MRKFLLIGFSVFLTGCFGSTSISEYDTKKFKISFSTFETIIPKEWMNIDPNNKKNEIMVAQKNDQNFIILHQDKFHNDLPSMIIENLEHSFFSFKLLDQKDLEWRFQGKVSTENPTREFYQKIVPIPNSTQFLLGSCSFEPFEDRTSDCEQISADWGISS